MVLCLLSLAWLCLSRSLRFRRYSILVVQPRKRFSKVNTAPKRQLHCESNSHVGICSDLNSWLCQVINSYTENAGVAGQNNKEVAAYADLGEGLKAATIYKPKMADGDPNAARKVSDGDLVTVDMLLGLGRRGT